MPKNKFTGHHKFAKSCKELYGFEDVLSSAENLKTTVSRDRVKAMRIASLYFQMKMQSVLAGNKVMFINGMTIEIVKKKQGRPMRWKKANLINPEQRFVYNPKRTGYFYTFDIKWSALENSHMKFIVAPMYRKQLNVILTQTDKDYPFHEHPEESIN